MEGTKIIYNKPKIWCDPLSSVSDSVFGFFISGSHLLHPGAEWRGASETLPEHGRGPEGSPALHPEPHGECVNCSDHRWWSLVLADVSLHTVRGWNVFRAFLSVIVWFFLQVENLKAVHPDYGNRVQTLLNMHNAEAEKVNTDLWFTVKLNSRLRNLDKIWNSNSWSPENEVS